MWVYLKWISGFSYLHAIENWLKSYMILTILDDLWHELRILTEISRGSICKVGNTSYRGIRLGILQGDKAGNTIGE